MPSFKFRSASYDPRYGRGLVHTAGDCGIPNDVQLHTRCNESGQDKESGFFIHYKRHSKQLVNSLKESIERPDTFTSCEYREGILELKPAVDYDKIRFMERMLMHLEKSHPKILEEITEIETSHKETCKKIKEIMVSDAPITPTQSFQKIIIDNIESACQGLKKSTSLADNVYLPIYVFRAIFDAVYANEPTITLSFSNNNTQLRYSGGFVLGQGDATVIRKLREVIEELVLNNDIKKRVAQYTELYEKLVIDERVDELSHHIENLYEYILGGQVLGGGYADACDLCRPPNLSP